MNNSKYGLIILLFLIFACATQKKGNGLVDEDQLGLITADVRSADTNLPSKALVPEKDPGSGERLDRTFENAPPLIPHSITNFTPITSDNNLCKECHLPENARDFGAVPISETHFIDLRPPVHEDNGKVKYTEANGIYIQMLPDLNSAYFNCTQCHVTQTVIDVQIENYFTPEFRSKLGLSESDLKSKLGEGVK